jgi:small-conductance mechanosensitive channel
VLIAVLILVNAGLRRLARSIAGRRGPRVVFWFRQVIRLGTALIGLLGLISIWFNDPTRLATAAGLVTAGLAIALQRVITALAGYAVILRGKTFNVGDRITMGGVRGDVIALGFIQTTIMEMGQPPAVQSADPAMWVHSRQYTGRVVTVTNDKVFTEPIYNYTREFPYVWEEIALPVSYKDDRARAERILLDAASKHTLDIARVSEDDLREIERRFAIARADLHPRVYWRLTDNWVELTVRFIARTHGTRDLKDALSRDILAGLDAAGIGVASSTFEIVGLPPLRLVRGQSPDREP